MQDSLKTLETTQNKMQKSQADLIAKMDDLDHSLVSLREKLDESQKKMGTLSQKLDDLHSRLSGRMESISTLLAQATTQASIPVPGDLYRTAYGDYQTGKYDLAISGFKTFLERYPNSDLADSAQYYLADSYLSKQNFDEARLQFDKVLTTSREFRARALLRRSYALAGTNQEAAQKETLKALIKEFPSSPEGQTAKQILDSMEPPPPPPAETPATPKEKSPKKKETE